MSLTLPVGPLCEKLRYKAQTQFELWLIMISFGTADKFRFEFGEPFRLAELSNWQALDNKNFRLYEMGDCWRCEEICEDVWRSVEM